MKRFRHVRNTVLIVASWVLALSFPASMVSAADTTLSDLPLYSASNVPANLMLALSVEFPTGTVAAYTDNAGVPLVTGSTTFSCTGRVNDGVVYDKSGKQVKDTNGNTTTVNVGTCYFPKMNYLGYFDPLKCYKYDSNGYFTPSKKIATSDASCGGDWSGNALNWATMTALDEFRKTLTGGTRDSGSFGDTTSSTVLVRSNLNGQSNTGNFPDRRLGVDNSATLADTAGDDVTNWTKAYFRSSGQGTKFLVANNASFLNEGSVVDSSGKPVKGANGKAINNVTLTYNAKVQVCVSSKLEGNCTKYGSNYKPEGLIQQNYTRIRVGASAYASNTGGPSPNGVVRALLRDNGPTTYNGNGKRQPNDFAEWDGSTGVFLANPAGVNATTGTSGDTKLATGPTGTAFTQSGVINYLNKFGANGYETYDTIAELYWATLAYYMRTPLDPEYTNTLTADNSLDTAFPVFKNLKADTSDSNDPMQYTCAANAILVIGDSHTHCDQRVPSKTHPDIGKGNGYCALESPLPVVGSVDAGAYTTALGKLPLVEADGNSGTASASFSAAKLGGSDAGTSFLNSGQLSTYFIAGLAYYAHTNDIRPGDTMPGKQTVDTYVVDVMEPGVMSGAKGQEIYDTSNGSAGPNQYWLAAKYGGFADTAGNGRPSSFLTWHTNPSTVLGKDLRPDNYFVGNRPDLIVAGLASIFSNVSTSTSLSASGPSVSPTRVLDNIAAGGAPYNSPKSGFPIYTVQYFPGTWSGEVTGYVATAAIGADVTPVPGGNQWSAQTKLDQLGAYASSDGTTTLGWRDLRRVFTLSGGKGVPFRYGSLSSDQQSAIGGSKVLDFVRGDHSNESTSYRIRSHLLGDIVNSQATLVQGALSTSYTDANNPGYSTYASTNKTRTPVIYVGANDGMVHAFQGDFSATTTNLLGGGGAELWAYVPNLVYQGPNGTPAVDGLQALANLKGATTNGFVHHFYVDQTPQAADVDFQWTNNTPGVGGVRFPGTDWHTVLVGGLGKGGKGFYALDVSTVDAAPSSTPDTAIEGKIATNRALWEFTDSTMGYSFARPLIVKTRKYGWVVIATSGYNNADGIGYLYVINVKTGKLLERVATTSGSLSAPIGLARPSAYVQDVTDNTVEQVYAGDLQGNVWRWDLSSATAAYPPPVVIATLTDSTNTPQPITTAPRIELSFDSSGISTLRWVFVGTGKFLDTSDLTDTQTQSMYALRDGTGLVPATVTTPITRADLVNNDLVTKLNLQDSSEGWYYDLKGTAPGTGGATERIVVDPDAVAGIFSVNWGTLIPTADPCALHGGIYSADYATGLSNLLASDNSPMTSIAINSAVTSLQMVQLPNNGKFVLLYGQTGQAPATANMVQPGNPAKLMRTNWREILD